MAELTHSTAVTKFNHFSSFAPRSLKLKTRKHKLLKMWTAPRITYRPMAGKGGKPTCLCQTLCLNMANRVCSTPYLPASFVSCYTSDMSLFKKQPRPFPRNHTVVGWLPWETDADMETPCGGGFLGVILETDLLRGAGSCTPCRSFRTAMFGRHFSYWAGDSGAQMALERGSPQSWVSVSLNQPVSRGGLPCGGSKTLGKQLVSAEGNAWKGTQLWPSRGQKTW